MIYPDVKIAVRNKRVDVQYPRIIYHRNLYVNRTRGESSSANIAEFYFLVVALRN